MSSIIKELHAQTDSFDVKFVQVQAMSEEHARRMASLIDIPMNHILNVTTVKNPREAKTCRTDDIPTKGTRKWQMIYQVHAYGYKIPIGRDHYDYVNMELVRDDIETKTEAVKIAREMAVKHQLPMTVQVVQKSISHSPTCADIEPRSTLGTYEVRFIDLDKY